MRILELLDTRIRVLANARTEYAEPAIALVEKGDISFGQVANAQLRANPAACESMYLQKIDQTKLDTLHRTRLSSADLLYRHLESVKAQGYLPSDEPTYVVVPSDRTSAQISLILAVLQAANVMVADFVDVALSSATSSVPQEATFLSLYLNRAVLTPLQVSDVLQLGTGIPNERLGVLSLANGFIRTVANQSLSETRFDPRAFGHTEQQTYEQLMLGIMQREPRIAINVEHNGERRELSVSRSDLSASAESSYQTLQSAIPDGGIVVLDFMSSTLPGLVEFLEQHQHSVLQLSDNWHTELLDRIELRTNFNEPERELHRQVQLPRSSNDLQLDQPIQSVERASHILRNDIATQLIDSMSYTANGQETATFSVLEDANGWRIKRLDPTVKLLVDDVPVEEQSELNTGSVIKACNDEYRLISVH